MAATETLSLEQILGFATITEEMYETTSGLPDPLPEAFSASGTRKEVVGDSAMIMIRRGQRQTARRVEYAGKARNRGLVSIGYKEAKCVYMAEEMPLDINLMLKLRDTTSWTNQRQGRDEATEQHRQFAELFKNTEIAMRQMMLANGHIYFDAEGNLLPSSSGAVLDVDYHVPANNKNQLNGVISSSWADPDTNIPLQVATLTDYTVPRLTGLRIKYAFYTKEIPGYLTRNTHMQAYLARNTQFSGPLMNNPVQLPNGLLGIENWVPVTSGFFEDQNATNQDIWPADSVTFTPSPAEGGWMRNLDGSIKVPKDINIDGQGLAAWDNAELVYRMGGYSFLERSPLKVVINYFLCTLPALQNPDAIFQADVTP